MKGSEKTGLDCENFHAYEGRTLLRDESRHMPGADPRRRPPSNPPRGGFMTRLPNLTLGKGSRRGLAASALAVSLVAPTQASAFFQQTSLEGTLGTDLGGIWLSVQNVMPEF